jgi:predicted enzyme related to lactoylglutathione lyase
MQIYEVSNAIKGIYEYWSVYFGVKDINKTKSKVIQNEGSVIDEDTYSTLLADSFGAFFYVVSV